MYEGTVLIDRADAQQVNRALLDLLKKANELSKRITALSVQGDKLSERIKRLEDAENN
jgi:chaperonin cofactor prefoldin